jgi:hypothetical protein
MLRNVLYSLFFHLLIILLVYLNFDFHRKGEEQNRTTVSVSFVTKNGNSTNTTNQILKTNKQPENKEKIAEVTPEPKKEEAPKKDKKTTPPKKKTNKKIIKKEGKPKPNINDVKVKNIEPPKSSPKVKEEAESKQIKTEEVAKEPEPLVKKEQKPEIAKDDSEQDDEDVANEEEQQEEESTVIDKPNSITFEDKQKLENIDLLFREKFNIELQIKRCYKRSISESGKDSKAPVNIHVIIDKDGSIDLDLVEIQDYEKYSDPTEIDFHIAVDNVKRALTLCSPLRNLPEDKYDIWHEINLQFDDKMK